MSSQLKPSVGYFFLLFSSTILIGICDNDMKHSEIESDFESLSGLIKHWVVFYYHLLFTIF